MLLVLSAFSTSKQQSAFTNQYFLKKKLSRLEIIFKVTGQWKIMGTGNLSIWDASVFYPPGEKGT